MIILGIDPGTTRIGFGVISVAGSKMKALEYGIISNPGKDRAQDLMATAINLAAIIKRHRPIKAGIEKLFFTTNRTTGMAVSEMRGAILLILAQHSINVSEFTPQQVKQAVSGYGRAQKGQVESMVRMILGIKEPIHPDDAADALAVAICASASGD
ncbi:MAG: crossover junction endodeoxyribonuclease RuvC [Patescibacteria group bacterium]